MSERDHARIAAQVACRLTNTHTIVSEHADADTFWWWTDAPSCIGEGQVNKNVNNWHESGDGACANCGAHRCKWCSGMTTTAETRLPYGSDPFDQDSNEGQIQYKPKPTEDA